MQWVKPWQPIDSPPEAAAFAAELQAELAPDHYLYGLPVRAIARRADRDDVLFALEDGSGRVAWVHLTWALRPERLPWPMATMHDDFEAWMAYEEQAGD